MKNRGRGLEEYLDVIRDPVIKNSLLLALFIRLIPFTFFFLNLKYDIAIANFIKAWNILNISLTLAFPIWLAALYYLPYVVKVKNNLTRSVLYIILLYIILTPILVVIGAILTGDPQQFFQSYRLLN